MRSLSLAIVGADHPNKRGPARRWALNLLKPGDPLQLVPEPKNPKDEYAVAVFTVEGVQVGYVTAERAPWIGAQIRQGREFAVVFQGAAAFGGWARIAFDGEVPMLPPVALAKPAAADDWYPDEIPPDE